MLILARQVGEAIIINNNIRIVVTRQEGNTIWIGVDAPKEIPVHRQEIHTRIAKENRAVLEPAPVKAEEGNIVAWDGQNERVLREALRFPVTKIQFSS